MLKDKNKKLAHRNNSGRLRPHEHTSYLPLCLLLLVVGLALSGFTAYASHPGPEAGSIGLTGIVPGKAPTVAATITTPSHQQHFTTSPIEVSGSCSANTLVEIFKNDIFAGSTSCSPAGIYALNIDLLIGQNTIIARVYDALNQPGPDSNSITVFYDVLPHQSGPLTDFSFTNSQLLLNTDAVFRGTFPGQELSMPIDIIGGTAPYALNVQWGDTTNKVIPRNDNIGFSATHTYTKPGTYQATLQASDAIGHVGFLTVAVIVNGQPITATGDTSINPVSAGTMAELLTLWPLYASAIGIVGSFWIGERRERYILSRVPLA